MFQPVQFGKYYLSERIAVGGMAEIYKAKLYGVSGFEKQMVVKQILPQYARNAEFIKMFINEAKISVSLSHGNIIPVYELGRIDGIYFIAMEYVDGKNLADLLEAARQRNMPLSADHAIFIAIEICKGLDYAHRRTDEQGVPLGVVHRDISPSNVLVTMGGEVKIADFGIAKATDKLGTTDVGVVKGSFGYMSPEQIQGLEVDHRTDIFNAGILLHEMITGRRLFDGSDAATVQKIKDGIITLPSMIAPSAPVELDPIILQALAKCPDDRFAEASDLQMALSRILFSTGVGATSATLADYMRGLFPAERPAGSPDIIIATKPPTRIEGKRVEGKKAAFKVDTATRNATQSYAVRAELQDIVMPDGASARTPRGLQFGAKQSQGTNRGPMATATTSGPSDQTMMLPSALGPEDEATLRPKTSDVPLPVMPIVPELRPQARGSEDISAASLALADAFRASASRASASSESTVQRGGAAAETTSAETTVDPSEDPAQNAPLASPAEAPRDPASPFVQSVRKSGPRSDASVMALLLPGAGTASVPTAILGSDLSGSGAGMALPETSPPARGDSETSLPERGDPDPKREDPSAASGRHEREPDENASLDGIDVPTARVRRMRKPSKMFSTTMQLLVSGIEEDPALDEVPRHLKPTLLGWVVIGLLVATAAAVVIYKKTNLFQPHPDQALLGIDDIKSSPKTKTDAAPIAKKFGAVALTVTPANALVFRYAGDAPLELLLPASGTSLVAANRDGYRTVYRSIDGGKLTAGETVALVTSPLGAGGDQPPPEGATPVATGGASTLVTVASDPTGASIWVLVGAGSVELAGLERKRYDFKVMAKGFETGIVSIGAERFESAPEGKVKETISLSPAQTTAADTAIGTTSAPAKAAPAAPRVKSAKIVSKTRGQQARAAAKAPKAKAGRAPRKPRRPPRRHKRPALTTPSWAN